MGILGEFLSTSGGSGAVLQAVSIDIKKIEIRYFIYFPVRRLGQKIAV